MSTEIYQAFIRIHNVVNHSSSPLSSSSQLLHAKANTVSKMMLELEQSITPPLIIDYSMEFLEITFQVIQDIIDLLRSREITSLRLYTLDKIIRLPVAVFANLVHRTPDILEFIVNKNTLLVDCIFSSTYVETYIRCMAMLLETSKEHKNIHRVKHTLCHAILSSTSPIFEHLLSCSIFSDLDYSILQNIFTIFVACMRLDYQDETDIRKWLDNIQAFLEKSSVAVLHSRADACFFTAFHQHHQSSFSMNDILFSYYTTNIGRLVNFICVNAHNLNYVGPITASLVFIYSHHDQFLKTTKKYAGQLLSAFLTIFRVNAHCLVENIASSSYNQQSIAKFTRSLLFNYPKTCSPFLVCIDKAFHHSNTPLAYIIASMNAISCCNEFLLMDDDDGKHKGEVIINTWFTDRLPKILNNRLPIVQMAVMQITQAYCGHFPALISAQRFLQTSIIENQLIDNSTVLSSQVRGAIFSLLSTLVERQLCMNIVRENFTQIIREVVKSLCVDSEHANAEKFLKLFYRSLNATPENITLLINHCSRHFIRNVNVPDNHVQLFFKVLTALVNNCTRRDFPCLANIRTFLANLLQSKHREGAYSLLTSLVNIEGAPSVTTTKLIVQYIATSGEQYYQQAQSLCCFYYTHRPNSLVVVNAMLTLTFSLHDSSLEVFVSFFTWIAQKNINFSWEYSRNLLQIVMRLNVSNHSYLITALCARLMLSSSAAFIDQFLIDIDTHWSHEEFLSTWLDKSLRKHTGSLELVRLVRCALSNCITHYRNNKINSMHIQRTIEFLVKESKKF